MKKKILIGTITTIIILIIACGVVLATTENTVLHKIVNNVAQAMGMQEVFVIDNADNDNKKQDNVKEDKNIVAGKTYTWFDFEDTTREITEEEKQQGLATGLLGTMTFNKDSSFVSSNDISNTYTYEQEGNKIIVTRTNTAKGEENYYNAMKTELEYLIQTLEETLKSPNVTDKSSIEAQINEYKNQINELSPNAKPYTFELTIENGVISYQVQNMIYKLK